MLSDNDLRVLDAAGAGHTPGEMANVIRELGFTQGAYYQRLSWLLDQHDAVQARPMLVNRLRRLRDQRTRSR